MLFEAHEARHFVDKKYGLCHCVYTMPTDARVLLSHRWVEHSRSKQQGSFSSLPLSTWVFLTHTHKCDLIEPPSSPPRTFNNPRRTKKSALMAARFEKRPSAWKADPFKVMPGAESWTTRGIFTGFLHLSSVSERQRPNMQLEIQYVHLSNLFTVLLLSLKN